jgi:hypothetical protein
MVEFTPLRQQDGGPACLPTRTALLSGLVREYVEQGLSPIWLFGWLCKLEPLSYVIVL